MASIRQSSKLDELPSELLLDIIRHLDYKSLARLNLMNRRLHQLTRPHFYSAFHGSELGLFLRTMVCSSSHDRISLANLVKSPETRYEDVTEHDRHAISTAFSQLDLPDKESQVELAANSRIYGNPLPQHWYTELFLLFFPALHTFSVESVWHWHELQFWFRHLSCNASRLPHLRRITLRGPLRLDNIMHLFLLPSLKELELWHVVEPRWPVPVVTGGTWEGDTIDAVQSRLSTNGSNVESLVPRESYIDFLSLRSVIAATSLKHFTYEHKCTTRVNFPVQAHFAAVGHLKAHAEKLTSLTIRNRATKYTYTYPLEYSSDAISQLQLKPDDVTNYPKSRYVPNAPKYPFPDLRRLELDMVFPGEWQCRVGEGLGDFWDTYLGMDVNNVVVLLNPGLEVLVLGLCFEWEYHGEESDMDVFLARWFIKRLAEKGKWEENGVREVRIETHVGRVEDEEGREEWREIREIFEDAGVKFELKALEWGGKVERRREWNGSGI